MADTGNKPRHGLFSRKDQEIELKITEKFSTDAESSKEKVQEIIPVSFSALFRFVHLDYCYSNRSPSYFNRFSTKLELFLDFVGLVAAFAAGAGNVRLSTLHSV